MRAVLIGSSGLVLGREYALDAPVVTIGRRDENTIVIKDPTVSRKHAEIYREGESFSIVDKGSTSGITVNGQLISGQQSLRDGDRIGIGSSAVFMIQLQEAEDKTIAFSQQQFADSGRTQFITRDLGDPRAASGTPPVPSPPPAAPGSYRPNDTLIQNAPLSQPEPTPAPPPTPAYNPPTPPPAQSWSEPQRADSALPDFAPPRPSVDLGGPPLAPPTMPEMPRSRPEVAPPFGGNQPPAAPPQDFAPRFDAPPPMSAVTEFAPNAQSTPNNQPLGSGASQFGPPPAFSQSSPPSFSQPPAPSFAPPPAPMNAPGPMMSPPAPPPAKARGGRTGLIIALFVVLLLVVIAAVVVGLLLTGRLG